MKNGVYLVTEPACLDIESGSYHHISTGFNHLSREFDMIFFVKNSKIKFENSCFKSTPNNLKSANLNFVKGSYIKGSLKDLIILITNLFYIPRLIINLKVENSTFIYERTAYLNPAGLIAAKILNIPHFYEANGLQFERMEKYYSSFLKPIIRLIEKWSYKNSNHVFFVGTYGNYWNLKSNNWSNIENGIESDHISFFKTHTKELNDVVNLCFVARLMTHQRPDILIEALNKVRNPSKIHLYLIGSGLETIEDALKDKIKITNLGFQIREDMKVILKSMHIGIIAGSPEYQSTMKIFDYGSAKCAVIGPDITNFKFWFSDKIAFFKKNDATDFARVLNVLLKDKTLVIEYGVKIFQHISENFTWNKVYEKVTCKMKVEIDKNK